MYKELHMYNVCILMSLDDLNTITITKIINIPITYKRLLVSFCFYVSYVKDIRPNIRSTLLISVFFLSAQHSSISYRQNVI